MRPLHDGARRRLLCYSALLCAAPLFLAPLAGRSSFELRDEQAAYDRRFRAVAELKASSMAVSVARDPFVPDTPRGNGMRVMQGRPIEFIAPLKTVVRAIVTGPAPRALVEDNGQARIVGAGDELGGVKVLRIDRSGVRLQNGVLLMLARPAQ